MPANHMASLNLREYFPSSLGTPRAISTMMKPRCNYRIGLSLVASMMGERAHRAAPRTTATWKRLDRLGREG